MPLLVDLYARYNKVTDWNALASSVDGAYIKYSDGGGSPVVTADDYATQCRTHGIPYGGYHFAQPGNATGQARAFLDQYRRLGGQLAPALDLESGDIPAGARATFARQFLETVHQQYPTVVLYASSSWLAGLSPDSWGYPWDLTWCAEYGTNDGTRHSVSHYTGRVDMHQYTSAGRIPGVSGAVDLDWTTNLAAFRLDADTSAPSTREDDDSMLVPAGTNEHVSLIVKGKSKVYIGSAFGRKVVVHQIVWCADTSGSAPAYLPGGKADWTFDPGRPGPIAVPSKAAQMILRYTADHSYTVAAV